jgi:uncharacterized protein
MWWLDPLKNSLRNTFRGMRMGWLRCLQLDLAGDLEALLSHRVDLVVLNTAPVDLVRRVLLDGKLIAEMDRSTRIAFEVRTRNEYFDLLPYLNEYRRTGKASA